MDKDEQWLLEEKYAGQKTSAYEADKKRLAKGEPLGYIIGSQPFLGLKIHLDSRPLIPRPETEWWTEQLITLLHERNQMEHQISFLDLCTGSGAIGCAALAQLPNARVYFGDNDLAHEATVLKNMRENNLDVSRASVHIGDLFEPFNGIRFDVIAANPPYIPTNRVLPASVADHEPALALFAGEDGLAVIRRIAQKLPHHLAETGIAWIECDSVRLDDAQQLFEERGFSTEKRTDQYDVPRILIASHSKQ
ncbi:peptide chain release factor N(5)-glutamine methyltransferase [Candidatus Parcubacteria bacterium]|nr:peptide chain release factor N(5)-glutamine methyltransferase [Candidatus Parcubacteria bacterium]